MKAILAGFVVVAASSPAMPATPLLLPCQFDELGYEPAVERTIHAGLGAEPEISVIIYPSFASEWGIALVSEPQGPVLVLSQFASSYWMSGWGTENQGASERRIWKPGKARPVVSTTRTPVSANLAARLRSVWDAAMTATGRRDANVVTFDGVAFQFRVGQQSCGMTLWPDRDPMSGKLVSLVEQLAALAESGAKSEIGPSEQEALATAAEILDAVARPSSAP
jgi:hypothetical protein